ncbi:MAG: serine hydrolase [Pikeienuella sp.]
MKRYEVVVSWHLVLAVVLAVWVAVPRAEAAPYAAIVMDMRTGEVVHARGADRRQHPASLTKLMTLYLTFEAIESGQLKLDGRVRVSRKAARQPPSKLGMRPGQRVTVRDMIRATAIRSSNDAAMVLAEAIGGSQARFADLMTAKARELGMSQTRFKNPHGLTQSGHLSTARDMARLARALYFDFPEYYNLFGRKTARATGKRLHTTNRLLSTYAGAEGMKTGFTRAAGYNLAATAKRGERRVLAVLLGGKSSRWRNDRMVQLLDMGFKRTPARAAEIAPRRGRGASAVAEAPLPVFRPGTKPVGLAALGGAIASPAAAALNDPGSRIAPLYAELPRGRPARAGAIPAGSIAGAAPEIAAAGRSARALVEMPMPVERPGPLRAGDWQVQVGAYRDRRSAEARLAALERRGLPGLSGRATRIAKRGGPRGTLYLARFEGLAAEEAQRACRKLKSAGAECLALAPR